VAVLLLTVGLSGCNEQSSNSGNIQIDSHTTRYWGNAIEVYGTVKNVADKNIDYAEVTVKFYDKDNELLITKNDQVQYIGNGATKSFSVSYYNDERYFDQYDHYTVSVWSRE
jgi:hypothetical protein